MVQENTDDENKSYQTDQAILKNKKYVIVHVKRSRKQYEL